MNWLRNSASIPKMLGRLSCLLFALKFVICFWASLPPFVPLGGMAMVGGMTRVDRDVPPYCLVEGHPGRVRGLNRVGLRRRGLDGEELKQLQEVWSMLYRSDHVIAEGLRLARENSLMPLADHLCTFLEGSISKGRRGPMPAAIGR